MFINVKGAVGLWCVSAAVENEGWGGRWSRVSVDESAVLSVAEHAGVTNDSLKPHCQHTHIHTTPLTHRGVETWGHMKIG